MPTPDTTLRDYYTREEIRAHMEGRVGKIPEAVLGIIGDLEVTEAALNRLAEVAREWLAETDAVDADDPLIHDFYVRVGSVWGYGNFYRRFKEALGDD